MTSFAYARRLGAPRSAILAALAAASLVVSGCGRPAYATPPHSGAAAPPSAVAASSPPTIAAPTAEQPPTPVPATFDVADLAEHVKPVVVNITTTHEVNVPAGALEGVDPFQFFFGGGGQMRPRELHQKQTALGTGFIIDSSGYVATNNHVVEGADTVRVKLADDREFSADVVGRDPKLDLALLKLKGAKDLPAAVLGSSDQLRVGEHVLAVGNPFGLGHTVTLGIVSAKARSIGAGPYDDFIQTDASINPGNSGGPLFNWKGDVVGINTAIRAGANGIGFAIPIDALKDVLQQLRDKGHVDRGKLGLAFQPITNELAKAMQLGSTHGALVADVEPGGSAARAGIQPGDVIVAVNGTPITHAEELPRNVARNAPGSQIKIALERGKQRRDVTATLDTLVDPDAASQPVRRPTSSHDAQQPQTRLGLQVSDAQGGGVRIDGISEQSAGELRPGDVIVELAGSRVGNVAQLRSALTKVKPGTTVLAKVKRGELTRYAAVAVPR
jgi:serine protease Do